MILAKVIGTVWGAKQSPTLQGRRIVCVRPVSLRGVKKGQRVKSDIEERHLMHSSILAVDPLGADIGQLVLVSIGSRVRDLVTDPKVPTKHCVVAIVDEAIIE